MLLQADLGDRAGAVSTYHHCASVLERELGVIPDPVTRQAFQRLIADGAPDGASRLAVEHAPRSGLAAARLVGRSQELALLGELWRNAASGAPGLVLIRGGAGVGKSRMAAEIATMAGLGGAVVASSQCFGTSGRLALAPVADWLRHPAVLAGSGALDPAWRAEVGRLLPAEGREERDTGSRAMVEAWQRHRFFEGLARAMMAVGPTGRRCRSRPRYQACSRSATRVTGRSSGSLPPSATGPPQCGSPTNTWRPKRVRMLAWAGSVHSRWGKPYVTGPPSREKG